MIFRKAKCFFFAAHCASHRFICALFDRHSNNAIAVANAACGVGFACLELHLHISCLPAPSAIPFVQWLNYTKASARMQQRNEIFLTKGKKHDA
jgi:hypothetical protein